jgi:hypothetical protein
MKKSKGHIAFVNDNEYFVGTDGEVYRAQLSDAFDVKSKNRIGRWECSLDHALHYAKVLGLKTSDVKKAAKKAKLKESVTVKIKKSQLKGLIREVLKESRTVKGATNDLKGIRHRAVEADFKKQFNHAILQLGQEYGVETITLKPAGLFSVHIEWEPLGKPEFYGFVQPLFDMGKKYRKYPNVEARNSKDLYKGLWKHMKDMLRFVGQND